ncbi:MAG: DUF4381 domain-containing protein [Lacunisphaera sp.]
MNPDPASLDRLHDIVAPPSVPWWPPAPGWYYVIVLLLVLVLVLAICGLIHRQRNRYRREALAEFARQEKRLGDPAQRVAALAVLAELLKRAAVTAFPREQVAALTGPVWFSFLDQTGRCTFFSRGEGARLEAAVYDPAGAMQLDEAAARVLAQRVRHWLRHHRINPPRPSSSYSSSERSDPSDSRREDEGRGRRTRRMGGAA